MWASPRVAHSDRTLPGQSTSAPSTAPPAEKEEEAALMKRLNGWPPTEEEGYVLDNEYEYEYEHENKDYDSEDKVLVIIIIKQAVAVVLEPVSVPVLIPISIVALIPQGSLTYLLQIVLTGQCRCIAHDDCFRHEYLKILQSMSCTSEKRKAKQSMRDTH